jgi:demethylmenaquinone methyltransferase / 2-methoxy-6-polyprenyl-1,4-benzoquinol methylase
VLRARNVAVERSRAKPNEFARELFGGLPGRYDALAEVLSFGQNLRWRTAMVDSIAAVQQPPRRVLDVATGTAGVALMLTDRTDAEVVGVDLTVEMLRRGRERVARRGRTDRVCLVLGRGEQLPFPDSSFDAVTFTYLLRYVADPSATLSELARVVKPGGMIASLEFAVPPNVFWRSAWRLYTRLVLPTAGLLTGGPQWARVGRFLGPSIEQHYRSFPVPAHVQAWESAGLRQVITRRLSLGGCLLMWGQKRDG